MHTTQTHQEEIFVHAAAAPGKPLNSPHAPMAVAIMLDITIHKTDAPKQIVFFMYLPLSANQAF